MSAATHWVFGYGSLIWNPGFRHLGARPALLAGAHRQLCIYSHSHRGTAERPGLVFGLVRGGSCRGMAFEVADEDWEVTRAYLRQREQVTAVYREAYRMVRVGPDEHVSALTYVADPAHEHYAGPLEVRTQCEMVRSAHGQSGPNTDYVRNTVRHLTALGIRDHKLTRLVDLLEDLRTPEMPEIA